MSSLESDIQYIKGVGPRLAVLLRKLGISCVRDLLYHFPRRYEDRRNFASIATLAHDENATICGRLHSVETVKTRGRLTILKVYIDDGTGTCALVFFNQQYLKDKFNKLVGRRIIAFGKVRINRYVCELSSPEWELFDEEEASSFASLVPIYPLTEGLFENKLRSIIARAVDEYLSLVEETLPQDIRDRLDLIDIREALREIHNPQSEQTMLAARKRLVFDELFVLQLALAIRKRENASAVGRVFRLPQDFEDQLAILLPFELTAAQKRVISEIARDMTKSECMMRLLQGDVGSGKTAVAMAAMLVAARCGSQTALMAPTEILAEQHYISISSFFERLGFMDIRCELLTGSLSAQKKRDALSRIAAGDVQIIIGTHTVIQEGVEFADLGLVVVDEQHRFGVMQRAALVQKGVRPDVLVMTATPIPRTLLQAVYGDLDVSVIDELPPGRKPIRTHWKRRDERMKVYNTIRPFLKDGAQVYVVCPIIEESEKLDVRAASDLRDFLAENVFPDYSVGLLHGQMKTDEKERIMDDFRNKRIDILVSTTVIEVGVDVPNASIMVIEDAERFGLAQLHQLRGRVGRGSEQSYCIMICDGKSDNAKKRMEVMCQTTDGFVIAEEDLKIRGPGELCGVRQSGIADFKIANIFRDVDILALAREEAKAIVDESPSLSEDKYRLLRRDVAEKYDAMSNLDG